MLAGVESSKGLAIILEEKVITEDDMDKTFIGNMFGFNETWKDVLKKEEDEKRAKIKAQKRKRERRKDGRVPVRNPRPFDNMSQRSSAWYTQKSMWLDGINRENALIYRR